MEAAVLSESLLQVVFVSQACRKAKRNNAGEPSKSSQQGRETRRKRANAIIPECG